MMRLSYFLYSLLLDLLVFGFGLAVVVVIGASERLIDGNLQQVQDIFRQAATVPFLIVLGLFSALILFCAINMMAKRIRDIGLPGWWTVLAIIILEAVLSLTISQQTASGLHFLAWIALLVIPSNAFAKELQTSN